MTLMLEILKEAKATGNFQLLLNAIPYARYLGLLIGEVDGARVGTMPYKDSLIGNPAVPAIHGGAVGALLESTAIFELMWSAESIVLPKVITMTVDYLRPAGPRDLYARAEVTRQGRRVATVHATAWQDDPKKPVAMSIVHLLLKAHEA